MNYYTGFEKTTAAANPKYVGVMGFKNSNVDFYLSELSDFYKEFYKDVKLKENEKLFRYTTDKLKEIGWGILVKVNTKIGRVYWLTEKGHIEDLPIFETRGEKVRYMKLK